MGSRVRLLKFVYLHRRDFLLQQLIQLVHRRVDLPVRGLGLPLIELLISEDSGDGGKVRESRELPFRHSNSLMMILARLTLIVASLPNGPLLVTVEAFPALPPHVFSNRYSNSLSKPAKNPRPPYHSRPVLHRLCRVHNKPSHNLHRG
jgi:hypothetical protein